MKKLLLSLAVASFTTLSYANPAIVYALGSKNDKSFNESAYMGMKKFKQDTGTNFREYEPTAAVQYEQALRRFSQRGSSPVIAIGFAQAEALNKVAGEFSNTDYAIIDMVVNQPNVNSVLFREQEGTFLVGMIAAMHTKTDTIGFVGGMDIPLVRAFACGYEQGAKYINNNINILLNMTGTDYTAWNNPGRASELAKSQFEKGSDIVFAAAGASGLGALQAAADTGNFGIGVDANQNYLHPGHMLTSMLKRVDVAIYKVLEASKSGTFKGGIQSLGLAENGVDWALDAYNAHLITDEIKSAVAQAKADIISGKIKVHDYRSNNSCDY